MGRVVSESSNPQSLSSPPTFAKYAARVRLEYAAVPLEDFYAKRSAFLGTLLALPSLYFSPKGKETLEAQVAPSFS